MRRWTDCKLFFFLFRFGRHYSSMLLILMSIEKCFAVYFPLLSKTVCTVRTAKWGTGIVGVVLAGYDSVYFISVKSIISKRSGRHNCVSVSKYMLTLRAVDSNLYSFVPFALMFVVNCAIAFKFMSAKCNQRNSTESTNQALVKAATRGTAMVVTVSITFLILTAPTAVYNAIYRWYSLGRLPWYRVFMNLTQYLNHSINGFLYCIVGSRFRAEIVKLICQKEKPDNSCAMHSITMNSTRYST